MRGKVRWTEASAGALVRGQTDIAEDLERLGLRGSMVTRLAMRLERSCGTLDPEAYLAVLEGAVAVCDTAASGESENVREIQRLMEGFADELRKLEEGLRIVSAYVVRMQDRASRERRGLLR